MYEITGSLEFLVPALIQADTENWAKSGLIRGRHTKNLIKGEGGGVIARRTYPVPNFAFGKYRGALCLKQGRREIQDRN